MLPEHLRAAAAKRSADAERRALAALQAMVSSQRRVSIAAVAREAGVSTDFIYGHAVLRGRIQELRDSTTVVGRPAQTDAQVPATGAVRALTAQLRELRSRHRREIDELETALAAAHGQLLELRRELESRGRLGP
ncbi:DUF6262 family protein [Nocardioides baekrokdamisoli]|nr:DUF6262 family protein [Nocardioides baekrokdamisoli]